MTLLYFLVMKSCRTLVVEFLSIKTSKVTVKDLICYGLNVYIF